MSERVIKFRGLTDKREWIYGSVLLMPGVAFILGDINCLPVQKNQVHPETVGQFTGLLDKNGYDIYEGDIVQDSFVKYVVEWGGAGFNLQGPAPMSEVIGSIYENPELLTGEL